MRGLRHDPHRRDIATRYCTGELFDDADVALTNGPAELGFPPLTEAMVDVAATAHHLRSQNLVTTAAANWIVTTTARAIFFADRTIEAIFELSASRTPRPLPDPSRRPQNRRRPRPRRHPQALPAGTNRAPARDWRFVNSPFWTERDTPRSSAVTPL